MSRTRIPVYRKPTPSPRAHHDDRVRGLRQRLCERRHRLDVALRIDVREDLVQRGLRDGLAHPVEELPLLLRREPIAELVLLRDVERAHGLVDELDSGPSRLRRIVVPLYELDEEPLVVEQFAREALEKRTEGVLVLVDRRAERGAL